MCGLALQSVPGHSRPSHPVRAGHSHRCDCRPIGCGLRGLGTVTTVRPGMPSPTRAVGRGGMGACPPSPLQRDHIVADRRSGRLQSVAARPANRSPCLFKFVCVRACARASDSARSDSDHGLPPAQRSHRFCGQSKAKLSKEHRLALLHRWQGPTTADSVVLSLARRRRRRPLARGGLHWRDTARPAARRTRCASSPPSAPVARRVLPPPILVPAVLALGRFVTVVTARGPRPYPAACANGSC